MNTRWHYVVVTSSTILVVLLLVGATLGKTAQQQQSEDAYRHLAVYSEVLGKIKSEYVEEPDLKSVTLGAVTGLLEAIDPYASFLNADQYKQYLKNKDLRRADVGLVLSKKFGYIGVVSVIPGSPAAKAGLTTGDLLESISGVATRDMPLAYAAILLQGDPGTTVEISVLRMRKPEPQKVVLARQAIKLPDVASKMLADNVGLITVPTLDAQKVRQVAQSVADLQKQGAQKFLLDLRFCATGTPEDGIALANLFLDKGLITYLQGQKYPRQNFDAQPEKPAYKQPLVVLTNRGTASAAEIAAAGLLDDKRAQVVGERTYGDAALRKAITMDDGSAVILSVAKYYSPAGKSIQDNGVTPSEMVVEAEPVVDNDDDNAVEPVQPKANEDLLLKRAIEVLVSGKAIAQKSTGPAGGPTMDPAKPLTPLNVPRQQQQ
jgi:carboxyl-terminal processing protease